MTNTSGDTADEISTGAKVGTVRAGVSAYKDRHGKTRWRFRRNGTASPLPGQPGEDQFEEAYKAALAGKPIRRPKPSDRYAPYGVIYVIQGLPDSPIKVGFSTDKALPARLATLQTGNPHLLRIIAHAKGYPRYERRAHAVLAADRMAGEWFAWTPRTEAFVRALSEGIEHALAV
jgi:hypothetical protein